MIWKLLVDNNENGRKSVKDRTEIKLLSWVKETSDPYHTYEVIGIYPPGSPKGGKRGKILCISNEYTIGEFFPHIIGCAFYGAKNESSIWVKYDAYGRPLQSKNVKFDKRER